MAVFHTVAAWRDSVGAERFGPETAEDGVFPDTGDIGFPYRPTLSALQLPLNTRGILFVCLPFESAAAECYTVAVFHTVAA